MISICLFSKSFSDSRPRETLKLLNQQQPPTLPGKSVLTFLLTLAPGGATPPHAHGNASIVGLMLRGELFNQFHDETEPTVYREGEVWYEGPGYHHVRSENVAEAEASCYAVVTVDTEVLEKYGPDGLMILDVEKEKWKQIQGESA